MFIAAASWVPRRSESEHNGRSGIRATHCIDDSETTMNSSAVAAAMHFETGISLEEYDVVLESFGRLDERLRSFPEGSVDLRLYVKERNTPSQRTSLEARIAGQRRMIATSTESNLRIALGEVRDDLIRQITDAKNRTEPRNNRAHRETL